MTTAQWFRLIGGLLQVRGGATVSLLTRLPVTPAIICLAVELRVGPTVLAAFYFNSLEQSALMEVLTEVVVLIQFTLIVVSLSILAHGTSVKPLMDMFWRHRRSLPAP